MSMKAHALPLLIALCLPAAAMATYTGPVSVSAEAQSEFAVTADTDTEAMRQYDILYALSANHPNERFRLYGQRAALQKQWQDAAKSFRTAARYADKYSQHRLSLMYWHGVGVPVDRVQAYIWSDLAAERGYPQFLAIRERMWRELSPEQQAAYDSYRTNPEQYWAFEDRVWKNGMVSVGEIEDVPADPAKSDAPRP
jgi:uncharacterized protein